MTNTQTSEERTEAAGEWAKNFGLHPVYEQRDFALAVTAYSAASAAREEQIKTLRGALEGLTRDVERYFGGTPNDTGPTWPKFFDTPMYAARAALKETEE
jgi:hypothetical protein